VDGLYLKAVLALHHARITDIKVYTTLQCSQGARTFIVPLPAISIVFSLFDGAPFSATHTGILIPGGVAQHLLERHLFGRGKIFDR
jgi:hypothetical protein